MDSRALSKADGAPLDRQRRLHRETDVCCSSIAQPCRLFRAPAAWQGLGAQRRLIREISRIISVIVRAFVIVSAANDRVVRALAAAGDLRVITILVILISSIGSGYAGTDIVLDGGAYRRSHIVYPGKFGPPIEGGALPEALREILVGWAEFDFTARETGWRKFDVDAKPFAWSRPAFAWILELTMARPCSRQRNGFGLAPARMSCGWSKPIGPDFLRSGRSHLRVRELEDGPAFRLLRPAVTSFRSGQCPKLGVEVGGTPDPFTLQKHVFSNDGSETTTSISVDPSDAPRRLFIELPCAPGDYRLALAPNGSGRTFQPQIFDYTVFGADRVEPKFVKRRLLEEIDLTATPPDFASGATSVESGATGSYRVTESHGFTGFQRRPTASARQSFPAKLVRL